MKIVQEKFYPNNVKWSEPNCFYLGSLTKDLFDYDLGLWVSQDKTSMSWFFVQSEDTGDYQSGIIFYKNKLNKSILKNKYNNNSSLPIIEILKLSQSNKFFNKCFIKDFNFNKTFIYDSDITSFLINPYKLCNITLYLNKNMKKLTNVIIIEAHNHWANRFFHKGKYYLPSDIFCIEDY